MIVTFDTQKEAREKFNELQKKHAPKDERTFYFEKRLDKGEESVVVKYELYPTIAVIKVEVDADPLVNLLTAMKIVDLMSEV